MQIHVPPKRLSLEAARGTELNTAAWAIFDAVRAAAQRSSGRTALPQDSETRLTRAAGRTVRFCHDDCPPVIFILARVDRHLRYRKTAKVGALLFERIFGRGRYRRVTVAAARKR